MSIRSILLAALCLGLAACGGNSLHSNDEALFVVGEAMEAPGEQGPYDAAWHVSVDLTRLEAAADGEAVADFMHGPDGLRLDAVLMEQERGGPDVWHGRLRGREDDVRSGTFTLTRIQDRLAGRLSVDGKVYSLSGRGSEGYRLYRLDLSQMPPPGPPVKPEGIDGEQ